MKMKMYDENQQTAPAETKPGVEIIMVSASLPPVTVDGFVTFLKKLDENIPKVKLFLSEVSTNTLLNAATNSLAPNLAKLIPELQKLEPWLDFLQEWDEAVLKMLPTSGS